MDKDKILEILADILDINSAELKKMPETVKLTELELTSLQFIQFIIAIEEKFNIEVLDSDLIMSNFETLENLYKTLTKYFFKEITLKKVLICDCDNVLWHGISGEEEIYTDSLTEKFQNTIIDLYNKGVLICLCSKNTEENITSAFSTLSMPLNKNHILLSKINFNDKASNIKELANELNLSFDSFVFVDDNPYELDLVSAIIPEITVVQANYPSEAFIEEIKLYFKAGTSDFNRTEQYRNQKERESQRQRFSTPQEFNASLKTKFTCTNAHIEQASRISELSMRTNQFNLSSSRYTENEIISLINNKEYSLYTLSVTDKYGDMGIVGAAIVKNGAAVITDFFLSCRVFGRDFEKVLIDKIKSDFAYPISGIYRRTDKNLRFAHFYTENGVNLYE